MIDGRTTHGIPRKAKCKGKGTPRSITPRACAPDGYLFAMASSKSKPTRRNASWDSNDYMVCAMAEPQKKLPALKTGKWNVDTYRQITLYGHDAQNMKQFTLHFQSIAQNDALGRPCHKFEIQRMRFWIVELRTCVATWPRVAERCRGI